MSCHRWSRERRTIFGSHSLLLLVLLGALAIAPPLAAQQRRLPPTVLAALQAADVPPQAMVALVQPVGGAAAPRLAWQARQAVNPASLMKLWPTYAALELLGPAWHWTTPVWLTGPFPPLAGESAGIYRGDIVIRGSGDPTLVVERLWLMWRRVRQLGIREIRGDIVLDRSAFAAPARAPGDFDDEPLRPYNVQPDALLLNHKAIHLTLLPDPAAGVARIGVDPPLAGLHMQPTVPLADGPCENWRGRLAADFSDPDRPRLDGSFAAACGEKHWPIAYPDPAGFNARLLAGLWSEMGGVLRGRVRDGYAPTAPPAFEIESPPLAEVVRDINKYSNNVMAQQLFLTLPLVLRGDGSPAAARNLLLDWALPWLGDAADGIAIDNGSGLSRANRVSALAFAKLLQRAWSGPVMADLAASLPASGLDGTLRRSTLAAGRARLKTGSLRDVAGIAGYVLSDDGQRQVVVAIINHPNANAARGALDALAAWAIDASDRRDAAAERLPR